jgi:hypothetical protein
MPTKVKKLFEGRKPSLFVNFDKFSFSWIRICIPTTDPDPGQKNEYEARSKSLF